MSQPTITASVSPVNLLPTELLLKIYEDVLWEQRVDKSPFIPNVAWKGYEPTPFYTRHDFHSLRLVCGLWSKIMESHPLFWSIIAIDRRKKLDIMGLALERSGSHDLSFTFRYVAGDAADPWLEEAALLLQLHLHRCRTIELLLPPTRMLFVMEQWIMTAAPRVRCLRLSIVGDEEGLPHTRPMKLIRKLPPLFAHQMPVLEELWLLYISFDWKTPQVPFSRLTTLYILHDDMDAPLAKGSSRALLSECQSLVTLRWMVWSNGSTVPIDALLEARRLTEVTMQNLSVAFDPSALDFLSNIQILDLDCRCFVDGSMHVVFDIFAQMPKLHCLTFDSDELQVTEPLGSVRKREGLSRLLYLRIGLVHEQFSEALLHVLSSFQLPNLERLEISRSLDDDSDRWTIPEDIRQLSALPCLSFLVTTWNVLAEILLEIMRKSPVLHTLQLDYDGYPLFSTLR